MNKLNANLEFIADFTYGYSTLEEFIKLVKNTHNIFKDFEHLQRFVIEVSFCKMYIALKSIHSICREKNVSKELENTILNSFVAAFVKKMDSTGLKIDVEMVNSKCKVYGNLGGIYGERINENPIYCYASAVCGLSGIDPKHEDSETLHDELEIELCATIDYVETCLGTSL